MNSDSSRPPVLVICDFSPEMMKLAKTRLEKSDFSKVRGNKLEIDLETEYVDKVKGKK